MSKPETWKTLEGRLVDGKFPLRQWLGGSDHSAVFLTELAGSPDSKIAIKLIPAESGPGLERQLSRLRSAIKLSNPHLIRILQAGSCRIGDESIVYAAMECADDDLSQVLPQRSLERDEMAELLPPLSGALSYLHKNGLVHGRIKPSNVLAVGNQLKLSSDQVSSVAEQAVERRRRDAYDAPEMANGIISPEGDMWSLGAMIVAALTRDVSSLEKSSGGDPVLPPGIPEPYRTVARKCLRMDPKQRCSLTEAQEVFQPSTRVPSGESAPGSSRASNSQSTSTVQRPSSIQSTSGEPKSESGPRKRPAFTVTIGLAILLTILFAIFYFRGSHSPSGSESGKQEPTASANPAPPPFTEPAKPATKAGAAGGDVAHQVIPDVPQSAKNTITGTIKVVVRVQVDASGKVTSATLKSSGSSRYFAGLALNAAQHWEFTAPEINGEPTASIWLVQFKFRRTSTQASAQRVTH